MTRPTFTHRHRFTVVRWTRAGSNLRHEPMVKTCDTCGRTWRRHNGRWVLTFPGRADR